MYGLWRYVYMALVIILTISFLIITFLLYQLATTNELLINTKRVLNSTEFQLAASKNILNTIQEQLDDTEIRLLSAENKLKDINNQLQVRQRENDKILSDYSVLRAQINNKLGLSQQDRQNFMTPDNSLLSVTVDEITGDYSEDVNGRWADYERLYRWVINNIYYSYDSRIPLLPELISGTLSWKAEYWRTPEETLLDETGDCEDMSTLLASMLENYNEGRYAVWLIEIQSKVPVPRGHIAVAFPVEGDGLTILDPAGSYYTGYPYSSLNALSYSVAVNRWLSHWRKEMPDAEIKGIFSDNMFKEFSGTDEFLIWLQER